MSVCHMPVPCRRCGDRMQVLENGYACEPCGIWLTFSNLKDTTIPCPKCRRVMDPLQDRYVCGGCEEVVMYPDDEDL